MITVTSFKIKFRTSRRERQVISFNLSNGDVFDYSVTFDKATCQVIANAAVGMQIFCNAEIYDDGSIGFDYDLSGSKKYKYHDKVSAANAAVDALLKQAQNAERYLKANNF